MKTHSPLATDPEPRFVVGDAAATSPDPAGRARVSRRAGRMPVIVALVGVVLVIAGLVHYATAPRDLPVLLPPAAAPAVVPAVQPPIATIHHPVENIPTADARPTAPLPSLDNSDTVARDAIATIQNGSTWLPLLVPEGVIRHFVATIDGLPQQTLAVQALPLRTVPGPLVTTIDPQGTAIAAENAARYAPYVRAIEAIDIARLTGFYVRLYPLLQQAYVDLGYPNGYFNDRAIGVIDHLLATPDPRLPVYLTQSRVVYQFADPALEELSAGQKILVRMGPDNERRVKTKLREIRKALAAEPMPR
jgi:hypothetical protein